MYLQASLRRRGLVNPALSVCSTVCLSVKSELRFSCEVQVVAGVFETAGARGEDRMEDRHILVCPQSVGLSDRSVTSPTLLAVFDGHRGASTAEFARRHFEEHLSCQAGTAPSAEALSAAFVEVDNRFREGNAVDAEGTSTLTSILKHMRLTLNCFA